MGNGTTRVLFFTPTLASGGADRVTVTLLRNLDRSRFTPTLALLRREGAFLDELPAHIRTIELGSRRLAVAIPALARVLRAEQPDVLFAMQGGANIVASIAHLLARSRARLVVSERSALRRPDRSAARTALELPAKRATYRHADVVTAVSRGVATALIEELGLARSKVHIVYNPLVDDDMRRQSAESVGHPWFSEDVPIIVAIGRLVEVKDYATMLGAFAIVRGRRPARLLILGEGPLREALESHARSLGIAGDVVFQGFDSNPFKYLARARAFVHTSKAEGLPGAIIQAMACGLPVVSTDADFGPREVICSGRDGFLVPVGDVAAVAQNILRVLDDVALSDAIGRAAKASAERFTTGAAMARYQAAMLGEAAPW